MNVLVQLMPLKVNGREVSVSSGDRLEVESVFASRDAVLLRLCICGKEGGSTVEVDGRELVRAIRAAGAAYP
jgi:hypothetical protein